MEYLIVWGKAVREEITSKLSFEGCTGIIQMRNTNTRNCKAQFFKLGILGILKTYNFVSQNDQKLAHPVILYKKHIRSTTF